MERRYEEQLLARLEDAFLHGCSFVSMAELRLWFDVGKVAAQTYRTLNDLWQQVSGGKSGSLMGVWGRDGYFIFGQKKAQKLNPDGT